MAAGGLVGTLHGGDRKAGGCAHGEHLGGRCEGIGAAHPGVVALEGRALHLALGQDEAAADRIVGLGKVQVASGVEGAQNHAVGVASERRAIVEHHAIVRVEGERAETGDVDPTGGPEVGLTALGLVGV